MTIINGIDMPDFKKSEFPEDPDKYAHPSLLQSTQNYRTDLGEKIEPSKAPGALARMSGRESSMHRILFNIENEIVRLSLAIDVFPQCDIFKAWTVALNCNEWNGIGVYFDTKGNDGKHKPMLHLDKRINPLTWYRDKGGYFYPHRDEDFYRRLLNLFLINRN